MPWPLKSKVWAISWLQSKSHVCKKKKMHIPLILWNNSDGWESSVSCKRILHKFLEIATGCVRELCHSANSSSTPHREPLYRRWEGLTVDTHGLSSFYPTPSSTLPLRCCSCCQQQQQKTPKKKLEWWRKIVWVSAHIPCILIYITCKSAIIYKYNVFISTDCFLYAVA